MTDTVSRPKHLYLAKTASFPGYWGSSEESPHHAIASCCLEGASRTGVFVVYDGYEGCRGSEMGGWVYLEAHGEPVLDGVYDAAGSYLGSSLSDAAKSARNGDFQPEHNALDWDAFRKLKDHKG